MALNPNDLATVLATSYENASSIANQAQKREMGNSSSDEQRGSLVLSYARGLLDDCRDYQNIGAVAILRSGLKHEKNGQIHYLGSATIGGWGFDVHIINSGWIRNDDARGFHNWALVGNSTQKDNTINVP